jgi:imidazolonepropionase-like amidohydrolase
MKQKMSRFVLAATATLGIATLSAAPTQAQQNAAVIYEGARLIVGDGSAPVENSAFVVETGRFTRIGKRGEVQVPAGAARVDLTGKTVMPALINTHAHLGPLERDYIDQLNIEAYCGVAVVASLGRDEEVAYRVRAEQPPNGAQLLTGGRGLVGPLGMKPETMASGAEGRLPEDLRDITVKVSSEEAAREHVRTLAAQHADFVKIWVDSRLGTEVPMKPNVYRAIIDESHKRGLRVYAHMWFLDDSKDLMRAGIDSLAHPIRDKVVDDEFVALAKDRPNVVMQTNLQSTQFASLYDDPAWMKEPLFLDIAPPAQIRNLTTRIHEKATRVHEGWPENMSKQEFAKHTFDIMVRNTQILYKAGVPFAVGTDTGQPPRGFDVHLEMEVLVRDVGLTPAQAITLGTKDAARALEMDRRLGTVESGKDASFLVLDANPLDNIANTRKIAKVYFRGREIDRAGLLAEWKRKRGN